MNFTASTAFLLFSVTFLPDLSVSAAPNAQVTG
jgi:hypothetical protein